MSNHSSAFPIETAAISLVMFFSSEPACEIPGNSTGADTVIPGPFPNSLVLVAIASAQKILQGVRHLAQIPEQTRHDAKRLLGDREQDVLVGRVLRAAGIGVWHPDRRQAKAVGNHIVGQRAAQRRNYRR